MALEEKLEKGASILFDDDPLANMVARGLGRGSTALGRATRAGLQRLRGSQNFPDDMPSREPPERDFPTETGPTGAGQDWSWLKDILSNIASDISSIRQNLIEQSKEQNDDTESERLRLIEDQIENKNERPQLAPTKSTEDDKSSGGLFGFLGAIASGVLSTFSTAIDGVTTAVNMLITGFNSLIAFLPTIVRAFSALFPVIARLGVAATSAYAALKVMQKLAPGLNDAIGKKTEEAGTKTMNVADSISWLKSKFTGKENYTGYYEKLFSQESPEKSMFTEGFLGSVNEYLDPQYKEKRDRTNKNLRIQSEQRAQAALNQDISGREEQLKSLENVPDMIGPDGQLNSNSASIQREQLTKEIEQLRSKKEQFDKYLAAKSGAGLEGRWIESVMDKNTGEMINNPLADASKYLSKEDYEKQTSSMSSLKDSNDELKNSIDKLNEIMNKNGEVSNQDISTPEAQTSQTPTLEPNIKIPSTNMKNSANFSEKAQTMMPRLMKDLNISKEDAAAILGNLGHESAGLKPNINEKNPLVKGSRGGYGWAQWTGARRRNFENFAQKNNLDLASDEANYQFLVHELKGTESGALKALRNTSGLEAKTKMFESKYERAGIKHYDSRVKYANMALQNSVRPPPNIEPPIQAETAPKVIPIPLAQPSPAPSMQMAMAGGNDQKQSAVNCTIDGSVRAALS